MMLIKTDENKDVIFRQSFRATEHPVQMYSRVWFSSRAMQLSGLELSQSLCLGAAVTKQDLSILEKCMKELYNKYQQIRTSLIPNLQEITDFQVQSLMQGLCGTLKSNPYIVDYWVVLIHNNIKFDSKKMKL